MKVRLEVETTAQPVDRVMARFVSQRSFRSDDLVSVEGPEPPTSGLLI